MKLAEVFRRVTEWVHTSDQIKEALEECNRKMYTKWGRFDEETRLETTFFRERNGCQEQSPHFQELMEFWNVYKDYDNLLVAEEKQKYPILQLVYEIDGIDQCIRNEKLLKQLSQKEKENLFWICHKIQNISNLSALKFLREYEGKLSVFCEMIPEEFWSGSLSFQYAMVQNKIIETMHEGGFLVIVSGSKGLTPQRLFCYEAVEGEWQKALEDVSERTRIYILAEHPKARQNGRLRGYK